MTNRVRLREIAEVFNGKTPSKLEQRDRGHPVLKIRDIDEYGRHRGITESFIDPALAAKYSSKWVRRGDTLILNAAHNADYVASKSFFAGPEADGSLATGEWLLVRPRVELTHPAFVNYWLRSAGTRDAIRFLVKGIHLYPKDVAELELSLPSIEEQRSIADLLARAEGILRLRREAQQKADGLIPAFFVELFGDPIVNPMGWPISDLGSVLQNGPNNGLYKHKSAYGSGTPILRIDAFYDGAVRDLSALKRLRLDSEDELRRFALTPGDIVINRVNSPEYLGKSAIIPRLAEPTVFESNMMRFAVDTQRVLPEFVIALLQHSASRRHFHANAKHAINQSSINQQDVKSLRVTTPPLDLQHEFKRRVAAAESIASQQASALVTARATFDALLSRTFA